MKKSGGSGSSVDERYTQWKSLVPVLYDWLANHNLVWPSLSCRWGPQLERATFKTRQRLYLSEQTDGTMPNTLVIANCEVVKPRVAAAEHISQFNEESRSPFVKKHKTIIHPGEVNRIRELPQNRKIIVTHTDAPEVFVWNVDTQPNCSVAVAASCSRPDLTLTGHTDNSEFALAVSPAEPFVLSGGKDRNVVLWNIGDHITPGQESSWKSEAPAGGKQKVGFSGGSSQSSLSNSPKVTPRGIFKGHKDTVEDVQFHPESTQEFCSVGDDSCLILWDARTGHKPALRVKKAHNADLHCVDWNSYDENLLLTGSADNSVKLFDRRKLPLNGEDGPVVQKFDGHSAAVLCVQWCPERKSVFGSSAEDGFLNIWDYEQVGRRGESKVSSKRSAGPPDGLFFQHAGHRDKVVDFQWNNLDPWTIVSVSADCEKTGGGGTLQIWRMNDMLYRSEEDVLSELEQFKSHILNCN